jgi:CRP-like cAMP-binding protein
MTTLFSISHILAGRDSDEFLAGFRKKHYPKGGVVCGPETSENGIFIVFVGKLRVYLIGEDREITLFYLGPGDIFCMHSGCIVEAVETSDIRLADLQTVEKKLIGTPGLGWKMFGVLGGAMLSSIRTIESLAFQDVKQRIAQFFLQQAGPAGAVDIEGEGLQCTLTIEDIAHLVGSARQTTSTALNALIKDGLVRRLSRGKYTIVDQEGLRALTRGGLSEDLPARHRKRA